MSVHPSPPAVMPPSLLDGEISSTLLPFSLAVYAAIMPAGVLPYTHMSTSGLGDVSSCAMAVLLDWGIRNDNASVRMMWAVLLIMCMILIVFGNKYILFCAKITNSE